jgi:hypothetical protein
MANGLKYNRAHDKRFPSLLLSGLLQQVPSVFPREGAKQLIDNERVAVWM